MVVDAGHEIGVHGYSHENPIAMTPEQEEAVLEKSIELIEKLSGRRPRGYVAPWWEMSRSPPTLLMKNGFTYDHSQVHDDFTPSTREWATAGPRSTTRKTAEEWMKPLVRGKEIDLVEIGANWYLDDLPPMMFIKNAPNSHGFVNPRHLEELWRDQFDWVYREIDYAVFPITIHPDVSGRPQVLLMLERLIEYISATPASALLHLRGDRRGFPCAASRAGNPRGVSPRLILGLSPRPPRPYRRRNGSRRRGSCSGSAGTRGSSARPARSDL